MLAALISGNSSVTQLNASNNSIDGQAGAKAFGDMLFVNKSLQTLDVSGNSFGKMLENVSQVKLKSSGEMCTVTKAYRGRSGSDFWVMLSSGKESEMLQPLSLIRLAFLPSALAWPHPKASFQ